MDNFIESVESLRLQVIDPFSPDWTFTWVEDATTPEVRPELGLEFIYQAVNILLTGSKEYPFSKIGKLVRAGHWDYATSRRHLPPGMQQTHIKFGAWMRETMSFLVKM